MIERFQGSLARLLDIKATYEAVNRSAVLVQQVRWRKIRTNPRNLSKKDRVKERTPIDPWEYNYLKTNIDRYRTTMKSLRLLFLEEFPALKVKRKQFGSTPVDFDNVDDEEHEKLILWNDEENRKTKALRDARLAKENKEKEELLLSQMMKADEEHANRIAGLEELVRKEKEASKNFITLENMTEKIEEAIDNKKNYDFLLTKTGRIVLPEDTSWTNLLEKNEDQEVQSS